MRAKRGFTVLTFLLCLLFNGVLIGLFYYMAREVLYGINQWVDPFVGKDTADLGEDVRQAFSGLSNMLVEVERYLAPIVLGVGAAGTFLLWLFILGTGRSSINRGIREALALQPPGKESPKAKKAPAKEEIIPPEARFTQQSPGAAVQILSILQREGRFIDFLQEDLGLYEDAQIGAAVRSIHEGCKGALSQHLELKPVFEENEGAEITVPSGFDARAVRLTGNVVGNPPFKGILQHRGWRIVRIQLPQPSSEPKDEWIVAPAEVEVAG